MIELAQHVGCGDAERLHEMRHVEFVSAAGAGALLAGQRDLFLRDRRQVGQAGELARIRKQNGQGRGLDHCVAHTKF
jgi:hypothetical protein